MKTNEQIMNELQGTPFSTKTIYEVTPTVSRVTGKAILIVVFTDGTQTNVDQ